MMKKPTSLYLCSLVAVFFATFSSPAQAGFIENMRMNMQDAASPSAQHIHDFHDMLLYIITAIVIFVLALLAYVILRFNRHVSKQPKQFSHNVVIEVIWTVVPILILLVIVIPSMRVLYYTDRTADPEMTLKVTGYQWYWGYEYPDHGGLNFLSYMIPSKDIDPAKGQQRLLSTDEPVVLPVDTNIQFLITAADVIHSWAVPALGLKTDGIPGRLNETWVRITKPGIYYGQCSELCGKDHSFMPIEIHAVSKDEFAAWVKQKGGTMPSDAPAAVTSDASAEAEPAAQDEAAPAADEATQEGQQDKAAPAIEQATEQGASEEPATNNQETAPQAQDQQ